MMQHTQTHKLTRSKPSKCLKYEPETTPDFTPSAESSDEEGPQRNDKMSLDQLCQSSPPLKELHLTQDEFEALQGFGRFRHTPIFIDSFRDLASVVYIEPNPIRN